MEEESEAAFRRAIALDAKFADALGFLAIRLLDAWHDRDGSDELLEEALELVHRAHDIAPDNVEFAAGGLAILQALGRSAEAAARATALVHQSPYCVNFHVHRGAANLRLGKLSEGFSEYSSWVYEHKKFKVPIREYPQWFRSKPPGEVLIWNKEGAGDFWQFIRFAKPMAAEGWTVRVVGDEAILRLAARVPGVASVHRLDEEFAPEYQCGPLALPAAYVTDERSVPRETYLSADDATIERWRAPIAELGPGLKIGVVWQGYGRQGNDSRRSFDPSLLRPIFEAAPTAQFVALQKGHRSKLAGLPLVDLGPHYQAGDWLETAGIVANLDLVLTPDTGVAHLAGAMGKPVWIALSEPACWRWLTGRDDSPWYPSARLFRETVRGSWDGVFERVAGELARFPLLA